MKILYCTHAIYNSAGTERVLSMKANYFVRELGYEVIFVTTDQQNRPNYFEWDSRIRHIDLGLNYDNDIGHGLIKQYLIQRKKDKIYKQRLTDIIIQEDPDICISTMTKELKFLASIQHRSMKVAELHSSRNFKYHQKTSIHKGLFWQLIGKLLVWQMVENTKKYDALVVLTKEDKADWEKTNSNVYQIYNPLPYTAELQSSLEAKSMISVGRLDKGKNIEGMISVWETVHNYHPEWKLNIWGDGYNRTQLQRLIDMKGLNGIVCLNGTTSSIDKEYMKNSAFIMTSNYEGFPMTFLEASSFGLPIISYDFKCGPRDLIHNSQNGFLVQQNDEQGMADAICKIIENENLRKKMGQAAKETSKEFSQDKILPLWPKFFESLVNKQKSDIN